MSTASEEIYQVELLNRVDGAILNVHEEKSPIPRYQIGSEIEVTGAERRYYIVREITAAAKMSFLADKL